MTEAAYPELSVAGFAWDFAAQLKMACKHDEGTLLSRPENPDRARDIKSQVDFLFQMLKPGSRVLEIGTNCGHFTYLALLIGAARVDTIEIDRGCLPAIDMLKSRFGDQIRTYLGDSDDVLNQWTVRFQFDVAWVDGSHDSAAALKDLQHCERLGIPLILVDDYNNRSVSEAVHRFVDHSPFRIAATSGKAWRREAVAIKLR